MTNRIITCLAFATLLTAADFWEKKKFPEWTQKDAAKLLKDSPWATSVEMSGGGGGMEGGGGGRGGGGGGRRGGGGGAAPDASSRGGDAADTPGGGSLSGPVSATSAVAGVRPSMVIRWHSALPVKQAVAFLRFGAEAGTSPEAAKLLTKTDQFYIVGVENVSPRIQGAKAFIHIKGKEDIQSAEVKAAQDGTKYVAYFFFPRKPIALEDKEIEFEMKAGPVDVKHKFRLKDMVYEGNLEL